MMIDVVVAQAQTLPREHAPNASSRGTVVEAQVRLAKSEIEPVILAPSSFPLHFGGGGRAVRGQQWRGARRRRPRRAASRVDAAHDARGLQQQHLRQRQQGDVRPNSVRCAYPICRAMKLSSLDLLTPKMKIILRDESDSRVRRRRGCGKDTRQPRTWKRTVINMMLTRKGRRGSE